MFIRETTTMIFNKRPQLDLLKILSFFILFVFLFLCYKYFFSNFFNINNFFLLYASDRQRGCNKLKKIREKDIVYKSYRLFEFNKFFVLIILHLLFSLSLISA